MDDTSLVDRLKSNYPEQKKYQSEAENLRAERNKVSKEIGIIKVKAEIYKNYPLP